ncbi:MAG TPA: gamma-glutamylcyclotransferase family protein [Candidatus Binataceae bacterium]|nr:gamma-glutamylcyclotransferase family protein [Candidatus Binataceae bacterium]
MIASSPDKFKLFVYGTLLEPGCRDGLLGHPVTTRPACLDGYRVERGRYLYIVAAPGVAIDGLLMLDVSIDDFAILDRYEQLPHLYTRESIEVVTPSGERLGCWVYMPTSALIAD